MNAPLRAVWREPRPADPPPVGRWDRLLAAAFAVLALAEGLLRTHLTWRPFVTILTIALVPALLWRRQHPLAACLAGFGVAGLLSTLQLVMHTEELGLTSMSVIMVLLYALVRWGSGREIVTGLVAVVAVMALGMAAAQAHWPELIGGSFFVLLFLVLAVVFRHRADLAARQQREVRNEERLALARELHDTVAHHVSAIAVQAQAGRVVAATQPSQAAAVLAAIETEASRTLSEMRDLVRVLRDPAPATDSPLPGVADLPALARSDPQPAVSVSLTGDLTHLPPPVDVTAYRLAQEALTNAIRHARNATRVEIDVCRAGDVVRLRVTDDGAAQPGHVTHRGFGLTGMAERAELLGGSLAAGPRPEGGWLVEAVLPARMSP